MKHDFSEVSKRIPFKFQSHLNGGKEHVLTRYNEPLNIVWEAVTKYRNGKPGNAKQFLYVNDKKSKTFSTLKELLNANPLIGQLAEATYKPK